MMDHPVITIAVLVASGLLLWVTRRWAVGPRDIDVTKIGKPKGNYTVNTRHDRRDR